MKKVLAFIVAAVFLLVGIPASADDDIAMVYVTFTEEQAEQTFYQSRAGAVWKNNFKTQLNGLELRVYDAVSKNIDTMRRDNGDNIEVDLSNMPTYHYGNDDDMATLSSAIFTAVYAYEFDNPQYFWMTKYHACSMSYRKSDNVIVGLYVAKPNSSWHSDAFPTYKSVVDAETVFNSKVSEVVKGASGKGTFETLKYFNQYIVENCEYNPYVSAGYDYTTLGEMPWCAYSSIVPQTDSKKYPVCEGYAKALKVLCDEVGIECVLIPGTYENEGHMWNMVRMTNGMWFYVDTTFNDSGSSQTSYFLRGESMEKKHKPDYKLSQACRDMVYPDVSTFDYTLSVGDLLGDANNNGNINTSDASAILRHCADIQTISDSFAKLCADFNCDSKIDTADAAAILKFCAGMM